MKNHRGQSGRLLLEFIIVIGLIALFSPMLFRKAVQRSNELDDIAMAAQMRALSHAVTSYIDTNFEVITRGGQVFNGVVVPGQVLRRDWETGQERFGFNYGLFPLDLTRVNRADPIVLEVEEFSDFLPIGYVGRARIFQRFMVGMSREVVENNNGVLEPRVHAMAIALPGLARRIDPVRGARVSNMIGSGGGYVYPADFPGTNLHNPVALGFQGSWELELEPFFGQREPGWAGGAVVAVAGRDLNQAFIPRALYRYQMAGFPDANTMLTALDMGRRHITDIGGMDAQYIGLRSEVDDVHCNQFRAHPDPAVFRQCVEEQHNIMISGQDNMITFFSESIDGRPATIRVDGNTGRVLFGQYADPLMPMFTGVVPEGTHIIRPAYEGQNVDEFQFVRNPDGTMTILRDATGRPIPGDRIERHQVRPDAISAVYDIRIRELGGARLSELLPRVIHRNRHPSEEHGALIPAPGFRVRNDNTGFERDPNTRNMLCPVGHAPVISVMDAGDHCKDVPASGNLTLDQRRCLWPNPDYIPAISFPPGISSTASVADVRARIVNNPNNNCLPLDDVRVDRNALTNWSTTGPGARVQMFRGTSAPLGVTDDSPVRIFDANPGSCDAGQGVFNISFPQNNRFARQWDNIQPELVRVGYVPFYNNVRCYNVALACPVGPNCPTGSRAEIRCHDDAVFGKIDRNNFLNVTMVFRRVSPPVSGSTAEPAVANAVGFEVCVSETIEIMPNPLEIDARLSYLRFRHVTSPDCPISEGWGYVMRNRKGGGTATAPRGPFYFIRIPVMQFSYIGGTTDAHKVTGPMSSHTIFSYVPIEQTIPAAAGTGTQAATAGWRLSVQEGRRVNADVYCRFIPEAFEGLRR